MSREDAITTLVRRHQADVWRYLRVLGARPDEADDATQEAFVEVLRAEFEHRSDRETSAYLRRVARHRFIDMRRRGRVGPSYVDMQEIEIAWEEFAGDDGGDEKVSALRSCVESLDERQRNTLGWRYAENASRKQIARKLGVDEEGAKSLLRRVMARLRKCMEMRLKDA